MSDHDEMMRRHRDRREAAPWIPYHARRSDGAIKYVDDGATVKVSIEVASLGTLVILTTAKFSVLKKEYKWDQSADLRALIEP